jgi:hypothetical protein
MRVIISYTNFWFVTFNTEIERCHTEFVCIPFMVGFNEIQFEEKVKGFNEIQ